MGKPQSLLRSDHVFSRTPEQLRTLALGSIPGFERRLAEAGLFPLRARSVEILQLNVGRVCNQACAHCHVDAAPDRRESMSLEVFQECLRVAAHESIALIDITGGAPELNPHFRWFVESAAGLGKRVMVRCNLTIVESNEKFRDLPAFYAKHRVEVVSSLPFYSASRTDAQRGLGVFDASIRALQAFNAAGYGQEGSGLTIDLVYNPSGAFLPPAQQALEKEFKQKLLEKHAVRFNRLLCITNMPINRFLEYLVRSGNFADYMERLSAAFNPAAAADVMCRSMISVGWDGRLFDCDFNQMLDLPLREGAHIRDFNASNLAQREISTANHCYGCTAGAGSSCGGETVAKS